MKTTLPVSITSVTEAKAFLTELYKNNESFHPEDDANDIEWNELPRDQWPTSDECDQLNRLMDAIYALNEVPETFDPCDFLLDLFYADHPELIET